MSTVGLSMIVRNEESVISRALSSVRGLIDTWTIIDTGSTDKTKKIIERDLKGIPGQLLDSEWRDFGTNLTEMMKVSSDTATWNLRLHADMVVEYHEGMHDFLEADEDETIQAFQVAIVDTNGCFYRVPYLTRGGLEWWYVGATHEYLAPLARNQRPLLGLTLHHHQDGGSRADKFERDLELLKPGVEEGDPRAVFYTAQSLENLGRLEEALEFYRRRYELGGWEEEAWYSLYRYAMIRGDVDGLIEAYRRRPWRHEPLTAAAALVASEGGRDDLLFLDPAASPRPATISL